MASESLQECLEVSRQRLYPSLTDPNYLVLRRRREILAAWVERLPGEKWRVLDIGGRYQPYRPLFEAKTSSYIALDIQPTPLVSVAGSGMSLPFAGEAFDVVIATQVFEYLGQPHLAAAEVYRVLKPGGSLLMSVAAVAPRFATEECWRYLPNGLRVLLAAFPQIEIVPEIFTVGSSFRSLNLYLSMIAKWSWLRHSLHATAVPILNLTGHKLERLSGSRNDQFAANYSVLATK